MEGISAKISWLGHSSFRLEGDGKVLYIDPWQIEEGPKADIILITHDHHDHCSPDDIEKIRKGETIIVTVPSAAEKLSGTIKMVAPGDNVTVGGIDIDVVPAYNTNKYRSPGVHFHPKESNFVGYVVTLEGQKIYHTGDSDVIPEMKQIETDIALLPVSGIYVMTAEEAVEAAEILKPKITIPMHVGRGIGSMADAERFKETVSTVAEVLPIDQ